ncbi:MAG TPA: amino acid--tRNA ligase-related protein [Candidatus Saccharimonadales bacterium]|nr:amino acid--tRNA ligase-related protein [Candidatus Saccharimonadales bacterium]
MATLKDFRDERLRKLDDLKNLGVNPYPAASKRTQMLADITSRYDELQGQEVSVVGRIQTIRGFGKIAFIVVRDVSGELQLFLRDGVTQPLDAPAGRLGLAELRLLDSGDFVEATGVVEKTQTGEISVTVRDLRLLGKALRPMPSKQDGFTNKEERFRRRYVDMNVNTDVRERFVRRSKFWQATRKFLDDRGFTEVNIPVLEHTTGGADANPFVTHMDALDQDFYLRISHELPLKRLVGAGFEKVYDIGPRFRNENYSDEHLPEHVAMEWYWAYADWQEGIKFQEELFKYVLQETFGTLQFKLGNFEVDLNKPWEQWDYTGVIKDHYGIDPFNCTLDEVKKALADHKLEVEQTENTARGIDKLWKNVRKDVAGPIWLVNTPTFISPLSKVNPDRPETTQRAQVVIAGSELCNLFSELNDPLDQLNRFVEQQQMRDAGDDEAMMLDIDYVEMLEYGMPPACGLGYSERVFWIFEGVTAREGVPFPQLRSEVDEVTKALYPDLQLTHTSGRRPNTLSPDSPLMSEEHRLGYQMVVILNRQVEVGRLINAANHAVAGLVGTMHNPAQFDFLEYRDQSGELDAIIAHHPAIILQAPDSKALLKAYRRAQSLGLPNNVFIETMTLGSSIEEMALLQNTTIDELDFWGVAIFGKTEEVKKITKDLQLWK